MYTKLWHENLLDMNLLGHQEGEGRIVLKLIVRMEMNWTGSGSMSSCRIWC